MWGRGLRGTYWLFIYILLSDGRRLTVFLSCLSVQVNPVDSFFPGVFVSAVSNTFSTFWL